MREFERVGNLVFQFPKFIHEFGYRGHHNVPAINPYTEHTTRNKVKAELHEIIEEWILYPLRDFLTNNDGRAIDILNVPLTFIWGLVCAFPIQNVILYTVWYARGCKAVKVWGTVHKANEEKR